MDVPRRVTARVARVRHKGSESEEGPVRPVFRTISGPVPGYQTGSGCSTVFWVVIAIPLVIVALATSGIVSDVF
jgi:hypothetical protein